MSEIGKNIAIVSRFENYSQGSLCLLTDTDPEHFTVVAPVNITITVNHHLWVIGFLPITI